MAFTPTFTLNSTQVGQSSNADLAFTITRVNGDDFIQDLNLTSPSGFVFAEGANLTAGTLVGTVYNSDGAVAETTNTRDLQILATATQNTWEVYDTSDTPAKVADIVVSANGLVCTYVANSGTESAGSTEAWKINGQVQSGGADVNIVVTTGTPGAYDYVVTLDNEADGVTETPLVGLTTNVIGVAMDNTPVEHADDDGYGDDTPTASAPVVDPVVDDLALSSAPAIDDDGDGEGVVLSTDTSTV